MDNPQRITRFMLVFSIILHICLSLHTLQQQSSQLLKLKQQQKYLGESVNAILEDNKILKQNIATASTNQDKIALLEDALNSQRQKIFDIKNKIIYPFEQSQTACKQLKNKQKDTILEEIQGSRKDLAKLQNISGKMPKQNKQIMKINDDIQKELILLNEMQQTLKVQCKVNLSPTIFQTNLKAKNWILGPQTMDDIRQQYAQRAMIFHNVTNCPLQTPFFNSNAQKCILCQKQNPIFNMFTKECTKCQDSQDLDNQKRQCKQKIRFTNYSLVTNWNLDGGIIPTVDKNLTACPKQKPYFNGVLCVVCNLPSYWSVSSNLCKQCKQGFSFDQNTKKCQLNIRNQLTILQNNQWVTKNITKVLQDRKKILQINQTKGVYHYCPSSMQPYYDGTTCMYCKYFDMDTRKCVQIPEKMAYNQNMKRFVVPQSGKQTNPKTTKYISSKPLEDTNLTNCNDTFPYWDGIACVQCASPFNIFNVEQKKCSFCNADQIYVQKSHSCQGRNKIHISQNQAKLLATSKVSIAGYKSSLLKLINDNPQAIFYPCPQKTQYANLTTCFPCQEDQYFNVQTLNCVICDGTYIVANKTCKQNQYIFTNLKAPKIIDFGELNADNQAKRIDELIKSRTLSKICPLDKPYAIQNKTCGTCPDLFSYSTLKCSTCQQFKIYVLDSKSCQQAKMLVNLTDPSKVLLQKGKTINDYKSSQLTVKAQFNSLAKQCPKERPYTSDRQSCFNCSNDLPFFNYTQKECQNCQEGFLFDAKSQQCKQVFYITLITNQTTPKMMGYDNYNIQNFKSEQALIMNQQQYKNCTLDQPYGTGQGCQQCNDPTPYFDIKNKVCSSVQYLNNFASLGQNYLLTTSKSIDDYKRDQQQFKLAAKTLTLECPSEKPYTSDRQSCFACTSPDYLYNVQAKACQKCQDGMAFVNATKSCSKKFYITNFSNETSPFMLGRSDYTITDFQTEQKRIMAQNPYQNCSKDLPYGTVDGCRKCVDPLPYFDIKNRACAQVKMLTNFDKLGSQILKSSSRAISDYKTDQLNFQKSSSYLTLTCNSSTPYTNDRTKCFNCLTAPKVIFNLDTKQCDQCNDSQTFVSQTNQCQATVYVTLVNNQTSKSFLQSSKDYTINNFTTDQKAKLGKPATENCTSDKPYGSLIGCIACNSTNPYFNIGSKTCVACDIGRQFYNETNQCLTPVYLTNFSNLNIKQDEQYTIDTAKAAQTQRRQAEGARAIQCSGSTPFATLTSCINCNDSTKPYFNIKTMTCQGCIKFYQYFEDSKCQNNIILSNTQKMVGQLEVDNYTRYNIQKQNNFTYIQNKHVVDCPAQTPFYDGKICLACPDSQPIFDLKDKVCKQMNILKKTNVNALQFYIQQRSQTKATLQNEIDTLSSKIKIQLCPASTPYLSGDNCISCPGTAKYFNLGTKVCQKCGASDKCF